MIFQAGGPVSERLQALQLKALQTQKCAKMRKNVHESHMCTSSPKGQGTCNVNDSIFRVPIALILNCR